MLFYAPGERRGLLRGLGGKPGPFTHLNLAPTDTAFYAEADIDVPVVYQTINEEVAKDARRLRCAIGRLFAWTRDWRLARPCAPP